MTTVFRPEKPLLVMWEVLLLMSGLMLFAVLSSWDTSDGGWWVVLLGAAAMATTSLRSLLIRVVADSHGVDVANLWTRRHYEWRDIERFEVTNWSRRACLVTRDGGKHRFTGQQKSLAEVVMGRANHTDDVVDALNAMLRRRTHRSSA